MKNKDSFWFWVFVAVIGNTLATAGVAIFALFLADRFYATPHLDGFWEFEIVVNDTQYEKYDQLKVVYQVAILQEKLILNGVGEKHKEMEKTMKNYWVHKGNARSPISISGYIEKKLFAPNEVYIAISEDGSARQSTSFQKLNVIDDTTMLGKFRATAAGSRGLVKWSKEDAK